MADGDQKQTFGFQAEVKQLLHLMIHSLYSNKEIFLRELTSNASDALDKLRFESIGDASLLGDDPDLAITLSVDKDAGTVTITDNGIGMSRDEVTENLGTIARSGTAEFVSQLSGDAKADSQLIGQFGVGFYASFIVADEVIVETRRAGLSASDAVRWTSAGEGEYSLEAIEREARGTSITLKLKEDEKEFLERFRLTSLIKKYSDHIGFPVQMLGEGDEAELETLNSATALWTRSRGDVSDDEYQEFYKHLTHDFSEPLAWSHNKVEGKREYTSLVYLPSKAPFDLWNREAPRGLKLYVQRVFIMDDAEQFLPLYLRFVRGVIDSADLPLNVSRELLQSHPSLDAMRSALTKRVLGMLKRMASDEPEKYQSFWDEFGEVIKEGLAEDFANRDALMNLLRFATTHESAVQNQSLAAYAERMIDGQEKVYYLTAESLAAAKSSPHLEVFKKRGIEVLLLTDRLDEWMIGHLTEFDGKALQDIRREGLELPGDDDEQSSDASASEDDDALTSLVEKLKAQLGERVSDVRRSDRLVESPACLVVPEHDLGVQMRRMLEAAGQEVPDNKSVLEVNPGHALVQRLAAESDDAAFEDLALVILGQAEIAQGALPEDPGAYVSRLNRLLVNLADQ